MPNKPVFTDFPFSIDERGRSAETTEDEHVRDLIYQVLFTAPGERVNRPEFGCGLKQLVFAPASDALAAATEKLIHGSLIRWLDPVVAVEAVTVTVDDAEISVRVGYTRRDTGEKRQDVFRRPIP
ncbi:MAG: GPW/gp25 family protein [Nitrospina sp.]|nr:GPW/gp25 family protein [Nitrospina sp.]